MVSWRPSSVALLVVALGFALLHHSSAQNSPANYLRPHNAARAAVGVEPLTWDPTLQEYAQNYAEERAGDCDLDAVQSWVNEEQYYDYDSNSCQEGKVCGHYTQVVWRNTERVGCGRVRCDSGAYFIVCSYDPRGNWEGEWPYRFSS
ncbi:unnamed protein product [Spirodela intermedia]|uniref:SCP domain-containing protein n=1 Tax=Spirodela intermedia TaxID=51605 RepID=A0A7I8JEN9_SPIIN|nr:unnamed protein product [Spirodela intermedia]CAA6668225.1 unnamed protein product [Spirodela intermedia]